MNNFVSAMNITVLEYNVVGCKVGRQREALRGMICSTVAPRYAKEFRESGMNCAVLEAPWNRFKRRSSI